MSESRTYTAAVIGVGAAVNSEGRKGGGHQIGYTHAEAYGSEGAWESCWDCAVRDLVGWIDGGPEPILGLPSMLKSAELNVAAYTSMVRCDRVDLPLTDSPDEWPVEVLARRAKEQERPR